MQNYRFFTPVFNFYSKANNIPMFYFQYMYCPRYMKQNCWTHLIKMMPPFVSNTGFFRCTKCKKPLKCKKVTVFQIPKLKNNLILCSKPQIFVIICNIIMSKWIIRQMLQHLHNIDIVWLLEWPVSVRFQSKIGPKNGFQRLLFQAFFRSGVKRKAFFVLVCWENLFIVMQYILISTSEYSAKT